MDYDFDTLSKTAYAEGSTIEDKNALWSAVLSLKDWHFIPRKYDGNIQPYTAEANQIEPSSYWLYAFTDEDRAIRYAEKHDLQMGDLDLYLTIPNNENMIPWCEKFAQHRVKGIFFNAGDYGFYAPLEQLSIIKRHLESLGHNF